jgi:hypothetical protein
MPPTEQKLQLEGGSDDEEAKEAKNSAAVDVAEI